MNLGPPQYKSCSVGLDIEWKVKITICHSHPPLDTRRTKSKETIFPFVSLFILKMRPFSESEPPVWSACPGVFIARILAIYNKQQTFKIVSGIVSWDSRIRSPELPRLKGQFWLCWVNLISFDKCWPILFKTIMIISIIIPLVTILSWLFWTALQCIYHQF